MWHGVVCGGGDMHGGGARGGALGGRGGRGLFSDCGEAVEHFSEILGGGVDTIVPFFVDDYHHTMLT